MRPWLGKKTRCKSLCTTPAGIPWCKGEVPTDGEAHLRFGYNDPQAQAVFSGPQVILLTHKPLGRAISNPEAARRMALWAIELRKFDIQYRLHTAIKGQVVADFIAEYGGLGSKRASSLEYPHRQIIQQTSKRSGYCTLFSRRGRNWIHSLSQLPYD